MKIAYVITRSDVMGGASVHLLDLAVGAIGEGHEAVIYVGGAGVFTKQAKAKGLACVSLGNLRRNIRPIADVLCFFELRSRLKEYEPDVIHLHSSKAGIIGRLVAKNLAIPSVFTAHGWAFTEGISSWKRKFYLAIERFMVRVEGKVITVSDYDRALALKSGVGKADKLIVIHNGMPDVTVERIRSEANRPIRFIMVARFDEQKDQALLIHAFTHVQRQDWILELVGDGPLIDEVRSQVVKLGVADKVVFSGACNDVPERLAASDVFCLISNWEGLPLTILEAMRSGLPVIASKVGGVQEAVIDGRTGYVISRGDLAGLTAAIDTLMASDEQRTQFGNNGRENYVMNFTFEKMLEKTLEVYQNVFELKL